MKGFDFVAPKTINEVLSTAKKSKKVKYIAGGTNFLPELRHQHDGPADLVIDLMRVNALRGVTVSKKTTSLGALTTITDLIENKDLNKNVPILAAMAKKFAGPMIRNRATIAGNIVDGGPAADAIPPLLALRAIVNLAGPRGKRTVPLDKFLLGYRKTAIKSGELITRISFPTPPKNHKWGYYKLARRNAMAITVVGVAVILETSGKTIKKASISLGSVNESPIRCYDAEKLLEGEKADLNIVQEASELCMEISSPIDDIRASAKYRKLMCEVLPRRLLCQALKIKMEK
ncbi:MAG: xanthine dehydrogenase family protein subunit M [Nitrospinota bacterium]|nr:xanthine dehydrogenase family protein subunit M [Nitrospinota bacterium]